MKKPLTRITLLATIGLWMLLSCNLLTGLNQDYQEVRGTAQAIATQAEQIITQAQGIATEISESDAMATARAIATREGPALVGTAQALATQAAEEGYLQTAEAFITSQPRELVETLQAIATRVIHPSGVPEDIPLIADESMTNLYVSDSLISYYANLDLPIMLAYYKASMPVMGWEAAKTGNMESDTAAVLRYSKPDRTATITLTANPLTDQTIVLIAINAR
ncbi:MAG: hypothetical protein QW057_05415 [Candidatus Bathyarchaeia archaeon]